MCSVTSDIEDDNTDILAIAWSNRFHLGEGEYALGKTSNRAVSGPRDKFDVYLPCDIIPDRRDTSWNVYFSVSRASKVESSTMKVGFEYAGLCGFSYQSIIDGTYTRDRVRMTFEVNGNPRDNGSSIYRLRIHEVHLDGDVPICTMGRNHGVVVADEHGRISVSKGARMDIRSSTYLMQAQYETAFNPGGPASDGYITVSARGMPGDCQAHFLLRENNEAPVSEETNTALRAMLTYGMRVYNLTPERFISAASHMESMDDTYSGGEVPSDVILSCNALASALCKVATDAPYCGDRTPSGDDAEIYFSNPTDELCADCEDSSACAIRTHAILLKSTSSDPLLSAARSIGERYVPIMNILSVGAPSLGSARELEADGKEEMEDDSEVNTERRSLRSQLSTEATQYRHRRLAASLAGEDPGEHVDPKEVHWGVVVDGSDDSTEKLGGHALGALVLREHLDLAVARGNSDITRAPGGPSINNGIPPFLVLEGTGKMCPTEGPFSEGGTTPEQVRTMGKIHDERLAFQRMLSKKTVALAACSPEVVSSNTWSSKDTRGSFYNRVTMVLTDDAEVFGGSSHATLATVGGRVPQTSAAAMKIMREQHTRNKDLGDIVTGLRVKLDAKGHRSLGDKIRGALGMDSDDDDDGGDASSDDIRYYSSRARYSSMLATNSERVVGGKIAATGRGIHSREMERFMDGESVCVADVLPTGDSKTPYPGVAFCDLMSLSTSPSRNVVAFPAPRETRSERNSGETIGEHIRPARRPSITTVSTGARESVDAAIASFNSEHGAQGPILPPTQEELAGGSFKWVHVVHVPSHLMCTEKFRTMVAGECSELGMEVRASPSFTDDYLLGAELSLRSL